MADIGTIERQLPADPGAAQPERADSTGLWSRPTEEEVGEDTRSDHPLGRPLCPAGERTSTAEFT
jgi:hypothetical protein